LEAVSLGPEHRALFDRFRCTVFRRRWTRDIEDTIRDLADSLEADPKLKALGYIQDGKLLSLIVWNEVARERWRIAILATATAIGARRRGYAEQLKRTLLSRALAEGVLIVESDVHVENDWMLDLNTKLGADMTRTGRDYMLCTIDPQLVPDQSDVESAGDPT
jgi:hypothetical protein